MRIKKIFLVDLKKNEKKTDKALAYMLNLMIVIIIFILRII
jgi:hypothetical protein